MESADNLNMVSPTELSPMSNNIKLGGSVEALSINLQAPSQGTAPTEVQQHSQPSTPSDMLPARANSTVSTDTAWTKQQ